jgi:aminopeptidase-like protein
MDAEGAGPAADPERAGAAMMELIAQLYPICRSITGDGTRQTLRAIGERIPLAIREVPSGTQVFDWVVPREWNIRDAFVKDARGERVIDFRRSNLHVVNYSVPIHRTMPLAELRPHLQTLPEHPDWIPYRTSYYHETWGFCLSQRQLEALEDGDYEVCIDSRMEDGHLSYGECYLPGECEEEVLISCHACHPSLCNDNLSGIAVATFLAARLNRRPHRLSYRLLFIPGTIGSITWLSLNEPLARRIRHGLVLTCVGDPGSFTYKRSRRGDARIDRAVAHVLGQAGEGYRILDFYPYGYDERQYCSPGFDLPVGCLMRTQHGQFPQYHTSADNLEFVTAQALGGTLATCQAVFEVLEHDRVYRNLNPKCEPQLGRRGLYARMGGERDVRTAELAMLWVLNLSDGRHSLLDIAERAGLPFAAIKRAADALAEHDLLREQEGR